MSAIASYATLISGYIPGGVKDVVGLCPQISEAVRHITWISIERVVWPPQETARLVLVLGYTDGFQIWDIQEPTAVRELISRQDKSLLLAKLLPVPIASSGSEAADTRPLGIRDAPMMAYVHRSVPTLVRLFSLRANDDVHLLRLTEAARSLQASRRFFAVGFARQVELYDALNFHALFSVQCNACNAACGPAFALGHRWVAYNLPPQLPLANGAGLAGASKQLPTVVWDGLQYLGQVGQRTLDQMLMPPQDGLEKAAGPPLGGGVVAVRDAVSRSIIAQFDDHSEPVEAMAWDPSGLQLVTCTALGHQVLVHRALLGAEQALIMHDSVQGGLSLGSVVFQHLFTLSRGYTPAVISDIAVSEDGQMVALSSAKGTAHVFRLPPLHSAALGRHVTETGAVKLARNQHCASAASRRVGIGLSLGSPDHKPLNINACTRVRLGSVLLQEGLMPKCGFLGPAQSMTSRRGASFSRDDSSQMFIATRAGTLALYSLSPQPLVNRSVPGSPDGAGNSADKSECQAVLTKEMRVCRPFRHFTERRLSPRDPGSAAPSSRHAASSSEAAPCAPAATGSGTALSSPPLTSQASPRSSPVLRPRSSPSLASPRMGPTAASPRLGPTAASPRLGPTAASPRLGPAAASPRLGPSAVPLGSDCPPAGPNLAEDPPPAGARASSPSRTGQGASTESSKWLASIEMTSHVPVEVPLWLSPQLTFYSTPASTPVEEINATLRGGRGVRGRQKIAISRPERPGDSVLYSCGGSSPRAEERLSQLFGGALDAPLEEAAAPPPTAGVAEHGQAARVMIAPAWGAIAGEQPVVGTGAEEDGSLLQIDGVGNGVEEVEEEWVRLRA